MEVLGHTQDQCLILWYTLRFIAPFPRYLHGSLNRLCASVHWQDHVKSKEIGNEFGKAWEYIVIEGTRAQRQSRCLLCQGLDELRMTVSLVNSTIGRKKV